MNNPPYLSPRERVFKTLSALRARIQASEDLNAERPIILQALERASSWEEELKSADWLHEDRPCDGTGDSV